MIRKALNAALFVAIAASAVAAPIFTGNWKLNTGKSDFGPLPAPQKMDRVIAHADPSLKIKTTQTGPQGEVISELNYTTDGKEVVNTVRNSAVKGAASWEGSTLVIKSAREFQGAELKIVEKWTLSEDGKALTIVNQISAPQGEFEIRYAFDRDSESAPPPAAAATPAPAAAAKATPSATRPNFSGTWKLNVAKSEFGPIPPPESQITKIEHSDPAVTNTVTQVGAEGEMTYTMNYKTDGTEFKNEIRGNPIVGTAAWDGNVLVVNSKLDIQGMEIKIKQRLTMAEDGKSIVTTQQLSTPQGDFETKALLEKVEGK